MFKKCQEEDSTTMILFSLLFFLDNYDLKPALCIFFIYIV